MSCTVIAEAGVNHNGDPELAQQLVDVAAASGADVVKFQTYSSKQLAASRAQKADYQMRTTSNSESQLAMLQRLELPKSAYPRLVDRCRQKGIEFLSTPFDLGSAQFLVRELGMQTIKIPSGEVSNLPFLVALGGLGRRFILSTGMCGLGDVELALGALAFGHLQPKIEAGPQAFIKLLSSGEGATFIRENVIVLHCTSEYPAPFPSLNLRAMGTLAASFGTRFGLSDHSDGIEAPVAAVALGASVIEKHFTLDRSMQGPDHKASLEPADLKTMVSMIRNVLSAMGDGRKLASSIEESTKVVARRVLVASRDIRKGELFSTTNIDCKRAGDGLTPAFYWEVLGVSAPRDFEPDEPISLRGDSL